MTTELARTTPARALATGGGFALPTIIAKQGDKAAEPVSPSPPTPSPTPTRGLHTTV